MWLIFYIKIGLYCWFLLPLSPVSGPEQADWQTQNSVSSTNKDIGDISGRSNSEISLFRER